MNGLDEEYEDELQRILEGRDVQELEERAQTPEDEHSNGGYSEESADIEDMNGLTDLKHRSKQNPIERKDKNKRKLNEDLDSNERNREELNSDVINDENNENNTKVKVKVRRIVTNKQLRLNADKLIADSGLPVLPQLFGDIKFTGKGSELKDLNKVMFRLSHWAHRLFPSLTFDDFIDKCEELGNKRALKNFVHSMRYDMPMGSEQKEMDEEVQQNEVIDSVPDFDAIIAESRVNNISANNPMEPMDPDFGDQQIVNIDTEDQREVNTENMSQKVDDKDINPELNSNKNIETEVINSEVGTKSQTKDSEQEMSEDEVLREINSIDE